MRAFSIVALFALTVAMAADSPTIEPKELAGRLAKSPQIAIFQVGFGYQFRVNHIPGAVYAGRDRAPMESNCLNRQWRNYPGIARS